MKHLSRWRKRKQYAISLVTASETDTEQTESHCVNCGRCGVIDLTFKLLYLNRILFFFHWNIRTVEGDSPVDIFFLKFCVIFLE